ncbi:glycosyltransferase family 4 protein [Methanooceanicella nereidis]|nr:glycosyltransferase family 4 protein [Methanocella sp. CWC-04]
MLISFVGRGGMLHYMSHYASSISLTGEVFAVIPDDADAGNFRGPVNILRIPVASGIFRTFLSSFDLPAIYRLIKTINAIKPDVIHMISPHPMNLYICAFCDRGIKQVYTLHDPELHEERLIKRILKPLLSLADDITASRADKVIVHGNSLKDICVRKGMPENKIEVIPMGSFSFFTEHGQGSGSIPGDRFASKKIALFFGRIEPYKGLDHFINAAKQAAQAVPDALFVIAGRGNMKPYERLIRDDGRFFIINKYIPDDEVNQLFSASDIVVLPYISATQSGVVPVAYAFKKPVIVTGVGSLPEIVDDGITGLIVPPKDIKCLSGAMIRLLTDDGLRKEMGENAYEKMKNELSWEKISGMSLDIYKKIIS